MMNKIIKLFICVLSIFPLTTYAYEFVNPENEAGVMSSRNDIYSLKKMYEELAGTSDIGNVNYKNAANNKYWWPIGSEDTTEVDGKLFATGDPEETVITSWFGSTGDVSSHANGHGAIDIANYGGEQGVVNIIAAKDGVVVYPTEGAPIDCPAGGLGSGCGGGYGNYVIIEHSDGNYTLYGHMYANSITVKAGETVKQGQVIGKMGTSGDSSGTHLHFEFRLGENTSAAKVDPLDYVSQEDPRPVSVSGNVGDLLEFINTWEGIGCGDWSQTSTEYIACNGGDGVLTIGHGVTWEHNIEKFKEHGIDYVGPGTKISKEIIDAIEVEIVNENMDNLRRQFAEEGIDDLADYQLLALVSRSYNCGPYSVLPGTSYSFVPAYLKYNGKYRLDDMYSNNGSIWSESMSIPIMPGSEFTLGLQRRRVSEWILFTTGEVDYLESNFNPGKYAW